MSRNSCHRPANGAQGRNRHCLLAVGVAALWPTIAAAAPAPPLRLPSTVEPGREAPPQTEAPEGQFDVEITTPRQSAIPSDVETLRFLVKKITIEGSTVFKHGDLLPLIEPLIGAHATLREITAVAQAIEARYREEGFLLTRAYVPQQHTRDGDFKIEIIEAYIKTIEIEGVDGRLEDHIRALLAPVLDDIPLTSAVMERSLLLVNDLPGIHAVGLLKPSADEVGAADLQLTVSRQLVAASTGIDNRASRYSGPVIANADVAVNSLANGGEQLGAGVTRSIDPHKQRGYRVHYAQPLGSSGLVATSSFERTLAQPGYTLAPLGITTDSVAITERLSYPLVRSRSFSLYLDGGFAWKTARTDILGDSSTFDQWSVADLKLSFSQSGWLDGVTAGGIDVAHGLPVLGASRAHAAGLSRPDGDPDFTKLQLDLRRVQPLGSEFSVTLAAAAQHAFSGLLAGEEFALGGYQYGRGFDPAALTGDNGIAGSAELHYDTTLPLLGSLQSMLFYDQGLVWNHLEDSRSTSLSSVGLNLRKPLTDNVDISFEAAHRLHGPTPSVLPDQPARLMFSLQGRWW